MLDKTIRFFLENKLISVLLLLLFVGWGISVAPFNWQLDDIFPRDPVPVDAIPDLGENQQIIHTEWPGRSPPGYRRSDNVSADNRVAGASGS